MKVEIECHNNFPVNLGFKTFIKYYPTRYQVNQSYRENRTVVYRFKDGYINAEVDKLFVDSILELKANMRIPNCWLCVIPSSKVIRTKARFENFCLRISAKASIDNGYKLLEPIEDREEVHLGERHYGSVLKSIKFGDFKNKNIVLIDDVVTLGKSYRIVANHLRILGAKTVHGIMLAKTHWLEENAF